MKNNKYITIPALALMLLCNKSFAFDFKGIELGKPSTYENVSNTLLIQCHDEPSGAVWCSGKTTIVGDEAKAHVSINDKKIVETISVKFNPDSFENIASGLTKKYGKAKVKNSTVTTRMGVSYNQVSMTWETKTSVMILDKYNKTIDEGSLFMVTNEKIEEMAIKSENKKTDL